MLTGSDHIDAERAFTRVVRKRRRASVIGWLVHGEGRRQLRVYDVASPQRGAAPGGVQALPLAVIVGTVEPSCARHFDGEFRPSSSARARWKRIWIAEQRGAPLPPISVVTVTDGFALRDGHHRVSVARARGAATIDATIE